MFSKLRIAITLGAIALLTANTSAVKLRTTQDMEAVEATTTEVTTTTVTTTEATVEAASEDGTEEVEGVTITGAEGAEVTVEVDDDGDSDDEGDDESDDDGCGGNNIDIDI